MSACYLCAQEEEKSTGSPQKPWPVTKNARLKDERTFKATNVVLISGEDSWFREEKVNKKNKHSTALSEVRERIREPTIMCLYDVKLIECNNS